MVPFSGKVTLSGDKLRKYPNAPGSFMDDLRQMNYPKSFYYSHCRPVDGEDDAIEMLSALWTCKDYWVDCYSNNFCAAVSYPQPAKDRANPPVIDVKGPVHSLLFIKEIDTFREGLLTLNSYEKAARLQQTCIYETNYPNLYYVVGSKMWFRNSFVLSTYGSLLRMCADNGTKMLTKYIERNEGLWNNKVPLFSKTLLSVVENIRKFMGYDLRNSEKFHRCGSGLAKNGFAAHGENGIYSLISTMSYYCHLVKTDPRHYPTWQAARKVPDDGTPLYQWLGILHSFIAKEEK